MLNNEILPLTEIQEGLKDKRLYMVAKKTGLSYPTLKKLAEGQDCNYTVETLKSASNYVRNSRGGRDKQQ
jgi:hypothetical protein